MPTEAEIKVHVYFDFAVILGFILGPAGCLHGVQMGIDRPRWRQDGLPEGALRGQKMPELGGD